MTVTEVTSKRSHTDYDRDTTLSLVQESRPPARRRTQTIQFLVILATVALAGLLGRAMRGVCMEAPWTRDATVRAYVVTVAPEVAGRIVELPAVDNRYVHKGDLLMEIDPTNYRIAVTQAEAAVQQAQANMQNIDAQMTVQQAQISANQAQRWIGPRPHSYSHSSRHDATRPWRKKGGAPFRMPSSSRPSCISRKPRCRPHKKISTWHSGKSRR